MMKSDSAPLPKIRHEDRKAQELVERIRKKLAKKKEQPQTPALRGNA